MEIPKDSFYVVVLYLNTVQCLVRFCHCQTQSNKSMHLSPNMLLALCYPQPRKISGTKAVKLSTMITS